MAKKNIKSTPDDYWDKLSSQAERNSIEKGLAQLDAGKGVPYETVMKRVKKKYPFLNFKASGKVKSNKSLSEKDKENIGMSYLMKKADRKKKVSRKSVMKKLKS